MNKEQIINELCAGIEELDEERINKAVEEAIKIRVPFEEALNGGLSTGIRKVGERFESGELYLPHLVIAGDLMDKAVDRLANELPRKEDEKTTGSTIIIGTVEGDIHEIGKNIVALMMRVEGFKVVDIGVDVTVDNFILSAKDNQADIIGASALLTTTQYEQKKLIERLVAEDLRGNYKVMVGGGQVTSEWAKEIGADGFGKDAAEAVKVAQEIIGKS